MKDILTMQVYMDKWVRIFWLAVFAVFVISTAHAGLQEPLVDYDAYKPSELKILADDCKKKSRVIDARINDIKKNLAWLTLKINRIKDSGRHVSRNLSDSVQEKNKIIKLQEKEMLRLARAADAYEKAYQKRVALSDPKTKPAPAGGPVQSTAIVPPKDMTGMTCTGLRTAVKKVGLDDWMAVVGGDGGCAKMSNTIPILFSSGSAALAGEYKLFLKKLSRFLKTYDVKVYVSGFTDTDPIRTKQYPSNLELGACRASNIVHEMVRHGLKPAIFKIDTTGEYRFASKVASNNKSFQRRVQITVVFNG